MNPATASSMLILVFSLVVIAAGAKSLEKSSYNVSSIEKPKRDLVPFVDTTMMKFRDIVVKASNGVKTCSTCNCHERTDPKKTLLETSCCVQVECTAPPVACYPVVVACDCNNCA
ncbi:PREDICTED: uncharacterized protein LOC109157957 [Ipomoea nil]|uniref:uncharacterized protein LOC109157957 n=1 Tax=Ipomoea nil TaxID=35883 RepID=UPI000900B300|nr:PREDICTED: uncharacterized protein LOC109157957 [Ipomoea nil]